MHKEFITFELTAIPHYSKQNGITQQEYINLNSIRFIEHELLFASICVLEIEFMRQRAFSQRPLGSSKNSQNFMQKSEKVICAL